MQTVERPVLEPQRAVPVQNPDDETPASRLHIEDTAATPDLLGTLSTAQVATTRGGLIDYDAETELMIEGYRATADLDVELAEHDLAATVETLPED